MLPSGFLDQKMNTIRIPLALQYISLLSAKIIIFPDHDKRTRNLATFLDHLTRTRNSALQDEVTHALTENAEIIYNYAEDLKLCINRLLAFELKK